VRARSSWRWSANLARLVTRLTDETGLSVALFWAPGAADNPQHPGDDDKAAAVMQAVGDRACVACRTTSIAELAAALSLTRALITSDGGALHIGVACGLPTVAMFGNSDPALWGPWQVPHVVLQPPSRVVADLSVDQVFDTFIGLIDRAGLRLALRPLRTPHDASAAGALAESSRRHADDTAPA
jgi:ADP-heptose:LPS heptosyltransferase